MTDLSAAARATADVVAAIPDDALDRPTPCQELTVAQLVGHVHGLSQAFAAAARKDLGPLTSSAPAPEDDTLPADWRSSTPVLLFDLAEAWNEAGAWDGQTQVGGVDLPAQAAGLFALDEVVVHGWDLARSTGQSFDPGDEAGATLLEFLTEARKDETPNEIFGPVVDVAPGAPVLDRVVGLTGRDPAWDPLA